MRRLSSIAFADLASRRLSTALTVIAIALGTAVVAATFTTNAAVEDSIARAAAAQVGSADLVVEALDDAGFADAAVASVRAVPGVAVVAPEVRKRVFFRTATQHGFVEVLGVEPDIDQVIHDRRIVAGRSLAPESERAIVVGQAWAAGHGVGVGDVVELVTVEGSRPFEVIGVEDDARAAGAAVVRMPLTTAQSIFGLKDRIRSLELILREPSQVDIVKARLVGALPYAFVARASGDVRDQLRGSVGELQAALLFFGLIALIAGAVLVFNSLSLAVAQRAQEIGLLRAIGASTGWVMKLTLVQGLLLGAAGAAAGVVLGQLLAVVLVVLVGQAQGIALASLPFSVSGMLLSFVVGVGVTVIASLLPAVRAGRISPLAAMSTARLAASGSGRRTPLAIALVAAALLVFTLAPVAGDAVRAAKVLALVLLLPLAIYLSQFAVPFLAGITSIPVRRTSRGVGTIAERTVRRERGQTALTVSSFVISLALIIGLYNGAASFASAGQGWATALFPGEFVIVSPVDQPLELVSEFAAVPGVDQVSPVSLLPAVWQGVRFTAMVVDTSHYFQAFDFSEGERTEAFRQMRTGSAILIPQTLAREMELKVGDVVTLAVGDGKGDFTVAGVIAHAVPTPDGLGAIVMSRDDLEGVADLSFRFLAISAAPDADVAQLERDLTVAAEAFGMEARSQADLSRSIGGAVGGLLGLLAGLVAVGLIVGALGLANTMMMNIAQRTREIGILRAVGMARAKVRGMAIAEAAIMGSLGALLAIALGAYLTWTLVALSRTADLDPPFTFSLPLAGAVLVAGVIVAMIAALYPARLAARTEILTSLREG